MLLCLNLTVFAAYLGDIDGNGTLTASDARAILRHSAKLESIAEEILPLADVDKNGNVNAADARLALRMGAKLDELIEDHTHDYKTTEIQKQDCEKDGIIEYRCSVCDHSYQDVTKATGHNYTSAVTKEPTCGAVGVKEYTCSVCNHTYSEDIEALEHDYIKITEREPSCATGLKEFECSICGDIYTEESPAILPNHRFTQLETIKAATCAEVGIKEYTCEVCGEKKQEEISTKSHSYGDPVVLKKDTCIGPGEYKYTCKVCGFSEVKEIDIIDWHTYGYTYEVIKEATYNEPGENKYTCEGCGFVRIDVSEPLKETYPVYIHLPETPIIIDSYADLFRIDEIGFNAKAHSYDDKYTLYLYFTGEKTFGRQNEYIKIEYKIYDAEGYVVYSGSHFTDELSPGEKIKNSDSFATSLEAGEYTLKITNVLSI